ncbi:D-alanyl-D-alanine carboxypeptidase (penicillin-binding protein 5/6) [Microbacterium sp. SORGH_AS 888]|nr:D-alanyl-D-alanine carboxypeptidase (penicillin-binding protein 5/6) [Microbacterium sp. SORGH_AS_0888]
MLARVGDGDRRAQRLVRRRRRALAAGIAAAVVVAAGVGVGVAVARTAGSVPGEADMPWPDAGVAAIAVDDREAFGPDAEAARPMASLTKLVTALVVLDAAPLTAGEDGPVYVLDAMDAAITAQEQSADGVSAALPAGTPATERHLLELMLVASANDAARSLARHVFGDEATFISRARVWLEARGLGEVTMVDAAGMGAANAASSRDLLSLGRLAMADTTIASIVVMPAVTKDARLGSEQLRSTNSLLGRFGVDGLKTGHTDPAGYTTLFTAPLDAGSNRRVFGVILGAPSAAQRDTDAALLLGHVRAASR